MTEEEAVGVASTFARQKGYDTSQYNIRATKRAAQWDIYFQRKSEHKPRPGDFFTVYVDDQSRAVQRIVQGK